MIALVVRYELELFRRPACPALAFPGGIPLSARFQNALNDTVLVRRSESGD